MRQGADQGRTRPPIAEPADGGPPTTAATRGSALRGLAAIVAASLVAALVPAPAVAGPKGDRVARASAAAAAAEGCAKLEGERGNRKGGRRRGSKGKKCSHSPVRDDVAEDQGPAGGDDAVDGAAVPSDDQVPTDPAAAGGSASAGTPGPAPGDAGSTVAVVPSCHGLDWQACEERVRQAGFTNYDRAIDPYDNCGCGPGGTWRIIDDFGERIEGWTISTGAHIIIETNPDA